jgi:hypothetical protein
MSDETKREENYLLRKRLESNIELLQRTMGWVIADLRRIIKELEW